MIDPKEKKTWEITLLSGDVVKVRIPKYCPDCLRLESGDDRFRELEAYPLKTGSWEASCKNPNCSYYINPDVGAMSNMRY